MSSSHTLSKKLFSTALFVLLAFSVFVTPALAQSESESLQNIIDALMVQIAQLQEEIAQQSEKSVSGSTAYVWTRDLSVGDTGEDVRKLQVFLNRDSSTRVSLSGDGSIGRETRYFGPATARAVQRFQEKYRESVLLPNGLTKSNGYFGKYSRKKIKTLSTESVSTSDVSGIDSTPTVVKVVPGAEPIVVIPPHVSRTLSTSPVRIVGVSVCNATKMEEILAPATSDQKTVGLKCNPTLTKNDVITKQVVIEKNNASGVVLDCNGATLDGGSGTINSGSDMILVRSGKVNGSWSRPEDVTIRNCTVKGGMRVYGMGITGGDKDVNTSSKSLGHTERQQAAAPTGLTIENVTFIAQNRIPLFLSPGVTYTHVREVTFAGTSNSTSVYLAAESGYNTFENNNFTINPKGTREVFAIDGSAHNVIKNNKFSGLNKGGIFLYRNCGESGTVRHQKPQYNEITGNEFYYNKYKGGLPAIWLGSRTGRARSYCSDDAGYPFGSSIDNGSFAENNTVTGNKIVKLSADKMIRNSNPPNSISGNGTIAKRGDSLPVTVGTSVSRMTCPLYSQPICGEGEAIQSGSIGENGCVTASQCIAVASVKSLNEPILKEADEVIVDSDSGEKDNSQNDDQTDNKIVDVSKHSISVGSSIVTTRSHTTKNRLTIFFSKKHGVVVDVAGTVIAGPGHFGGDTWWHVKYENGLTAWSPESSIEAVEGDVLGASISVDAYAQLRMALTKLEVALQRLQ